MATVVSTDTFTYTGSEQTWVVPAGVTRVTVEAWGAQGADGQGSPAGAGGLGGYVKGVLTVAPGETLRIYVGQKPALGGAAGWNGGGTGGSSPSSSINGGGGGGASDVRQGGAALADRKAVAAGGGGGGSYSGSAAGGGGGGGGGFYGGGGGKPYVATTSPTDGSLGVGGRGGSDVVGARSGLHYGGTDGGAGGADIGADSTGNGGKGGTQTAGGAAGTGSSGAAGGGGGGSNYAALLAGPTTTRAVRAGDGQVVLTVYNSPPNAPTGLSPSGKTINRANTNRFAWTFSDPDDGDSQSQYDLRYRLTGAATWTVVSGTTPNTFRDFVGGTFAAGDYEWQVRTYDSLGEVGPYSSSAFFSAADAPAGPSITDPVAGQTISEETHTVVWSTPSQESFQVRTVADDGFGAPDPLTVYTDTGEVVSTSARSRTVSFAVNNRDEHVQVRVKDAGLWSSWISVNVTVSYTVPATPTVAVDDTTLSGAILVQASHPAPSGSQPTVTHVDMYRRVTSDGGDGHRVAADLAPTALFTDWAVASGVDYSYRVRAYGDNGTSSWSVWSANPETIDVYYGGAYA